MQWGYYASDRCKKQVRRSYGPSFLLMTLTNVARIPGLVSPRGEKFWVTLSTTTVVAASYHAWFPLIDGTLANCLFVNC